MTSQHRILMGALPAEIVQGTLSRLPEEMQAVLEAFNQRFGGKDG